MPRFTPIVRTDQLPGVGAKVESPTFDIKATYETTKHFEAAKDVAAFANSLGGTLLVGAAENDGGLSKYLPIDATRANEIATFFERAIRDRCRPLPTIEAKQIPYESEFVVVVNIWPTLAAPVGVKIRGDKGDGFGDPAWVFPFRTATQTAFITPENLPMYMNAKDRKTALLLGRIQQSDSIAYRYQFEQRSPHFEGKFDSYDVEANTVTIRRGAFEDTLPIDRILTVYYSNNRWNILFDMLPFEPRRSRGV